MIDPLLIGASVLVAVYTIGYLARGYRAGQLVAPSSIYAGLVLLHFAFPTLLMELGWGPPFEYFRNRDYAAEGMLFAFVALLFFQVGDHAGRFVVSNAQHPEHGAIATNWHVRKAAACVLLLLVAGWAARLHVVANNSYFQVMRTAQGDLEGPFYAAIIMAEQLPTYAICILSILNWRPNVPRSRALYLPLVGLVVMDIAYWVPSGRREPVILAILLPLLVRYLRIRQLPSRRWIVALAVAAVVWFPLAHSYRSAMDSSAPGSDLVDTVVTAATMAEIGSMRAGESAGEVIVGRLSLLEPVSASIRLIREGSWKPILGGSYAQALLSFIPRVIWPGKPDVHYGTDFGHAAGILFPKDLLTSISVTYFGEAYLNFQWGGLVPILLIGMLFGAVYDQRLVTAHRETWLLIYLVAVPVILYTGGTFALSFGGLIKLLPFFYVVGRFMEVRVRGLRGPPLDRLNEAR